jgi:hypothetical protein
MYIAKENTQNKRTLNGKNQTMEPLHTLLLGIDIDIDTPSSEISVGNFV